MASVGNGNALPVVSVKMRRQSSRRVFFDAFQRLRELGTGNRRSEDFG